MSRDVVLALGGGGARGLAHIGVLDTLERSGYRIAALAGTSIGGVMAAVYAAGMSPAEMATWARQALRRGLFRFRPSPGALLGIDSIRETLQAPLADRTFDDLRVPLAVTAVELEGGREVVLTEGRVLEAVLATIALPGIFPPQFSGDSRLVDGGVVDPVPVRPARSLHRGPVVAVVLSARPDAPPSGSALLFGAMPAAGMFSRLRVGQALAVFSRSLEIASRMFTDLRLEVDRPEVVVRPDVADIGLLDTPEPESIIEEGRRAMAEAMDDLEGWYGLRGLSRRLRRTAS